ncbi:putative reverse transcriptase domain-containing protein [Tanacetum coccineum]
MIQSAILKAGVLTDEAVRNGSLKRSGERRGDDGESSKEGNVKGDNKRAGTRKVFAQSPNLLGMSTRDCKAGYMMVNPLNARNPTVARGACYECGGNDHYKSACPRLNRAPRQGGNRPNQDMAIEGGLGSGNNVNPACGRAFVMGAEEALQDPNIMMGTFSLYNHYATMLFDFGANYSFVSTTFVPLLDIEPISLGFSYDIKIASGQLVEINKVIHDCKLEIEGHTFDTDLMPFGHGSFDVIIGMDRLSQHRAKTVCHERVVQIPLPHVEFRIDLIPGAMSVAKSPYCLAPTEMEESLNQLKELQDKGFIRPSSSPWEAPFLGHVVNSDGIHVDPNKIEAKHKKYVWGDEQDVAFQTLKDKLCNAPVLTLPDGPKDFVLKIHEKNYTTHDLELGAVVFTLKIWRHYLYRTKSIIYTDHKSLQHIFNQKERNMSQRRWIELFNDYDYEIRYHPGKENVVADVLSKKERIKPRRVRAINMTIQLSIKGMILAAQNEASEIERKSDGALYYMDQIWIPLTSGIRTLIMDEAHKSRMKKDIALYVSKCLTCSKVKAEHQRPSGLLHKPEIPELNKYAHFLPIREDFKMDRLARLYLNEIVARHGICLDISTPYHPQTDGQRERTIQTLEDMLRACVIDFRGSWDIHLPLVEFSYNNNYHSNMRCAPFEALYERKCRSPNLW